MVVKRGLLASPARSKRSLSLGRDCFVCILSEQLEAGK